MAGLYGNPVDYPGIEKICKDFGVKLIDDAAQSFGAKLNGRLAGTWGDAGFFSFSPGKSTPGHLGSFFWTSKRYILIRDTGFLYYFPIYISICKNG